MADSDCGDLDKGSYDPPDTCGTTESHNAMEETSDSTTEIKTEPLCIIDSRMEAQDATSATQRVPGASTDGTKGRRGKTHAKVSDEDKRRLVEAFDNEEDYVLLADHLNIKRSTARSIVIRVKKRGGVVSLPRGGKRESIIKVDNELRAGIEGILQANPTGTLVSISQELERRFPHKRTVSRSTIARVCDGFLFAVKDKITPSDVNREDEKVARRDFSLWYSSEGQHLPMLIFIGEKAFNVWTNRSRGNSRFGERAIRVVGGQRGKNLTLTLAISPQFGLLHAAFHDGDTTQETFQQFLDNLSDCIPKCFSSCALILKDTPIHRGCTSLIPVKFLPSKSPMINPTESAFAMWEMSVRAAFSQPDVQKRVYDRQGAAEAGQTLVSWRRDILKELGRAALSVISVESCATWQQDCQMKLVKSEQMKDLEF